MHKIDDLLNFGVLFIPQHPQKLRPGFGNGSYLNEYLIKSWCNEALVEIELLVSFVVSIRDFSLFFAKPVEEISYFLLVWDQISKLITVLL